MNKVFIGIPTVDGKISAELAMILIDWADKYSPNIIIHHQPFTIPHDTARNMLVKRFLETNATHFMGIDSDVVPPENALKKMLNHDKDCIVAITERFVANKDGYELSPTTYSYNGVNYETSFNFTNDKLTQIGGAGAGCFLAKREVFETIKRPYQFIYNNDGSLIRSEDLYFSDQLRKEGFELWADYSIECKHIKSIDINLLH